MANLALSNINLPYKPADSSPSLQAFFNTGYGNMGIRKFVSNPAFQLCPTSSTRPQMGFCPPPPLPFNQARTIRPALWPHSLRFRAEIPPRGENNAAFEPHSHRRNCANWKECFWRPTIRTSICAKVGGSYY